jgi:N,N'-diacetyllegionaminate synthase
MNHVKTKIIAEIGNLHEGSLGIAQSLVDMAAKAGADIVKFQMHIPEFESTKNEPFRSNDFIQDESRFDYWHRINFKGSDWIRLKKYCDQRGVEFLCTPFSIEAAKFLFDNKLVKRWKIGSGEITNLPLIRYTLNTGMEVLLSTGLITQKELDFVVKLIKKDFNNSNKLILMHCVSQYPTKLETSALHLINHYRSKYKLKVGHSDHSGNLSAPIFALTMSVDYLEVHVKPHDLFFGPDVNSSLNFDDLEYLITFRDDLSILRESKQTRDDLFKVSKKTAKIFRKGLYWSRSLPAGELVTENDIIYRKPEVNHSALEVYKFLGKRLRKDVSAGMPLTLDQIKLND